MKAPLQWLKQYVDIDQPVDQLAAMMTMTGMEIEQIIDPGAQISGVVVARIVKLTRHPGADRLQICMMDVGAAEPVQIVTGADNVFEGALVPAALHGARLAGGLSIRKTKMRGEVSEGMLCSGQELGIDADTYPGAEVDGILILRDDFTPGQCIKQALGIDQPIIDVKVYANRADCLSVVGVAREIAVGLRAPLRDPVIDVVQSAQRTSDVLRVRVEDPDLCPRYIGRVVRNVKIAPSPLWMRQALHAAGVRPINNIVDITNYVMLETGQPMHAFDLRLLSQGSIVVRRARAGESITTLDEKQRTLTGDMLVIADEERPTAIAGIMGGEDSGIHPDTTDVVFESANFDWTGVRLASRALGIRTESSARFEKSLPVYLAQWGMDRAMTLIHQLGAGEVLAGQVDVCAQAPQASSISVSPARMDALLGLHVPTQEACDILQRLGFGVAEQGDTLHLDVPPWRTDIQGYADIAEEIQRFYGFDRIPSIAPPGEALHGSRTPRQRQVLQVKQLLSALGLCEAMQYSFMAPSALDKLSLPVGHALRSAVRILNPLGEEYSLMRTTLAPAMLRSLALNQSRRNADARLFEISHVFAPRADAPEVTPDQTPCHESEKLCIGIAQADMDFITFKGIVEVLLERCQTPAVAYERSTLPYYHPGRGACMRGAQGEVGHLGELHPDAAAAFGLNGRIYLAEIDMDALLIQADRIREIKPLPKFPGVQRDLAVVAAADIPVGDMMQAIRAAAGPLLEDVTLFDIYQGEQVGAGKKSVAFSLYMRAEDHTLVDSQANACFDAVVRALEAQFGAKLRA